MPASRAMLLLLQERKKCDCLEAEARKDKRKCIRLEEEALEHKRDLLIKEDEMKQLKDEVGKWMSKYNLSHAWAAAGNLHEVDISEAWKEAIRRRLLMKTTGAVAARLTNQRRELSDLRDQMQYDGGKNAGTDLDSEASQSTEDATWIVAGDYAPEDKEEDFDVSGGDEDDHNLVTETEDDDDDDGEDKDNSSDEEASNDDFSSSNSRTSNASSQDDDEEEEEEEEEPPMKRKKTLSPLTSFKVANPVLPVSRARPSRASVPLQAQPGLTPQASLTAVKDEDGAARPVKHCRLAQRIHPTHPSMLAKFDQILRREKAGERTREILGHSQRLQHGSGIRECDTRSFGVRSRPTARPLFRKGVAGSWWGGLE